MALDSVKNFAYGTLTTGIDAAASSLTVGSGEGAMFPASNFNVVIYNFTDYKDPSLDPNVEILRVGTRSTDTFPITRAQEGTSAATHNTGGKVYRIIQGITAAMISDIQSILNQKQDTLAYASSSEVTTGTDTTKVIAPDALAGSTIFGAKVVEIQLVADATDVDTTSGVAYFRVPRALNGMNLVRAQADVTTAGTTNATTIQVRNMTKYSSNDSLSTAISVASGGTLATEGTVSTTYDDVSTDDLIKVYVTGQSTTKPKGLRVWLEYMLP